MFVIVRSGAGNESRRRDLFKETQAKAGARVKRTKPRLSDGVEGALYVRVEIRLKEYEARRGR